MEVTFKADKKLLDAINALAEAVRGMAEHCQANTEQVQVTDTATAEALKAASERRAELCTPEEEKEVPPFEAEEQDEPKPPVPSRDEVNKLAIAKIRAKHRDEVKALLEKYGAAKVSAVPEEHLAEFKAALEAL